MNVVSLIISAIAIVVGLGGLVAYFQKSRGDSLIEYQAKELDIRDKITIPRLEKELAALERENHVLKEQNQGLKELAQGSPELVKLTTEIRKLAEIIAKRPI